MKVEGEKDFRGEPGGDKFLRETRKGADIIINDVLKWWIFVISILELSDHNYFWVVEFYRKWLDGDWNLRLATGSWRKSDRP